MNNSNLILIVGAGLAGVSAAAALREAGHDGPVMLLGDEKHAPYDRPPLSKGILQRTVELQDIYLKPEAWYAENAIELVVGTAANRIEPDRHEVLLDDGTSLAYDKLLLTTGAEVRRIPALEAGSVPHFYLRNDVDAIALSHALEPGKRVVLIGAGVIGLEVAASAIHRGCEVTVLEICDRVMARAVPVEVSTWLQAQHEARGVSFRCLEQVQGYSEQQHAPGLMLANDDVLGADLVVIGAGVTPASKLARECGIVCADGIRVNEYGETSAEDIFAAGDVAWYPDVWAGKHMRSENWMHAEKHAKCVARNLLGARDAYEEIQTFWTDQYVFKLQIVGMLQGNRQVLRGSMSDSHFMIFYLEDDVVRGAFGVNQSKFMRIAQDLVRSRVKVDTAILADPAAALKKALP